ncbi:MAG: hypothetical protein Q4C59_11805 [Lachnospiraceae bacterium]|nr:hypothetical protein [Lachnospiraceae bacterium]
MDKKIIRFFAGVLVLGGLFGAAGCSRSQINYQIAESIGTLGQYENNEPVETPKMKAKREQEESEAAIEQTMTDTLEEASVLAKGYQYEQAIALLQDSDIDQDDERVISAVAEYQSDLEDMYEYDGVIPHLSFPSLIVDTERAFQSSGNGTTYASVMITLSEFEGILEELYRNGYFLIDIHSLMGETTDENGNTVVTSLNPVIPEGKKPFVLSVDNLDYSQVIKNGDGIATRLALDENGEVKAVYTDTEGHDLKGDYDVVPVLESFIQEHPDFSFQGARGIIGLTGKNGIFGYEIEDDGNIDYSENRQIVRQIADKLRADGWSFACETYSYAKLAEYSYEALTEEIGKWETAVGSLIEGVDILIYPYGSEVNSEEKAAYLNGRGFWYFIGLWATDDYREVIGDYMKQTRRMVNGYVFDNSPGIFESFFSVSAILDEERH